MTQNSCELCSLSSVLTTYEVAPHEGTSFSNTAQLCGTCLEEIQNPKANPNYWHVLNESIWSENQAVKILAWRILTTLSSESWSQNLLDQLYLEDDLLVVAKAGIEPTGEESSSGPKTKDSNGALLVDGDSVTLIKDLDVKGANFTAKRGTLVKNIVLTEDTALVEGRVNGTQIVLKTCFLKKAT